MERSEDTVIPYNKYAGFDNSIYIWEWFGHTALPNKSDNTWEAVQFTLHIVYGETAEPLSSPVRQREPILDSLYLYRVTWW